MNEASSKYVDQLALQKLLSEKLELVHHYPEKSIDFQYSFFDKFDLIQKIPAPDISRQDFGYTFLSPITSGYLENETCYVYAFETENAKTSIIFQHGLFEDNREIYNFLFNNLNKLGINVYLITLPYHYERKPPISLFSGEFFWSADIDRTRSAFVQSIYDLYTFSLYIQQKNQHKVLFTGFSMGATLCLLLCAIIKEIDGVIAINPPASLAEIVWDSPLCKTIKNDYLTAGYTLEQIKNAYKTFEPVSIDTKELSSSRLMICYGIYDQITSQNQYTTLAKKWGIQNINKYKSGHLNTLRIPRLAQDISDFIETL